MSPPKEEAGPVGPATSPLNHTTAADTTPAEADSDSKPCLCGMCRTVLHRSDSRRDGVCLTCYLRGAA